MRQYLLEALTAATVTVPMLVLSGQTGAAKTQLLQDIRTAVDLEKLANHRGSAFGKRVGGQPTQVNFENSLAIAWLKQRHFNAGCSIIVEDESHLIGKIMLPEALMLAMQKAQIGFQAALHVRNRMMQAYTDVMNMQV